MARSILAQNIRLIRDSAGASRNAFANYIGSISPYQLQAFEEDITKPKDNTIREIAEKVGITPEVLTRKLLTKKDIPVLLMNQNTDDLEKQNESLKKQIEQQQKVIDLLTKQLEKKIAVVR